MKQLENPLTKAWIWIWEDTIQITTDRGLKATENWSRQGPPVSHTAKCRGMDQNIFCSLLHSFIPLPFHLPPYHSSPMHHIPTSRPLCTLPTKSSSFQCQCGSLTQSCQIFTQNLLSQKCLPCPAFHYHHPSTLHISLVSPNHWAILFILFIACLLEEHKLPEDRDISLLVHCCLPWMSTNGLYLVYVCLLSE